MKEIKLHTPEFIQRINGFEKELTKENKSVSTVTENAIYIKEFLSFMEGKGITSIKAINQTLVDEHISHLEQRINLKRGGILSKGTINKHKIAINNFYKYLNIEKISCNVIRTQQRQVKSQEHPTVLTHEEIEWLYSVIADNAIGCRDRAMVALYYGCGLRKSEGLKLLITDIDFARGWIHIRSPKNKRDRYVTMIPTVQRQIEEYVYSARDMYLPEHARYEQLFIGERGTPVKPETLAKRIEALWSRVKERYGSEKNIGLHTLRHSLGTHLYMAGVEIEDIALMLGHTRLESTQLYIHISNQLTQ